jgi:hypothetical protein
LYAQEDGKYILYLENESDPAQRYASEPFELKPGEQPKGPADHEIIDVLFESAPFRDLDSEYSPPCHVEVSHALLPGPGPKLGFNEFDS